MLSNSGGLWTAWDDVTNAEVYPNGAHEARKTEVKLFKHMNAYTRCPRSCVARENGELVDVKWIDANKGDTVNAEYGSRLVCRDVNEYKGDSLYATTPPLKAACGND